MGKLVRAKYCKHSATSGRKMDMKEGRLSIEFIEGIPAASQ